MGTILGYITQVLINSWDLLRLMAPYLLFGFFAGGLLSVFVSARLVEEHLGGHGFWPVLKASAFGVPLPLCSCSVLPVSASLRRHGASRGAVTSFLISTPQTGVDSIFVTASLLGPVFAVFKPLAALVSGVLGGIVVDVLEPHGESDVQVIEKCVHGCCKAEHETRGGKIYRMFHHAFIELPLDIGRALVVGILIAGVISTFMPKDFFLTTGITGLTAILVLMLCGIPIYVCATASIPVAFALMDRGGASAGAALAFLMTGPASNAAGIAAVWKMLGARTALIYLGAVAMTAVASALALDWMFPNLALPAMTTHAAHEFLPQWLQIASVILLVVILIPSFLPRRKHAEHEHEEEAHEDENDGGQQVNG